ncbi:MAG: sporulation protein [Oscillospiraceae bacterium]|nr:sporulation protein [Oscillospiraceae bacterium]
MVTSRLRRRVLPTLALLVPAAAALGVLRWPGEAMDAVREGLRLCGESLIPALFPFLVLSSLLIRLGLAPALGRWLAPALRAVLGVGEPGAAALTLGLIGGYPVGAATVAQLYTSGGCDRVEAHRLLAFCNNAGPAFLVGIAGVGVYGSARVGLLLWGIHALAALLTGLLLRLRYGPVTAQGKISPQSRPEPFLPAFLAAVQGSVPTLLNVCAFVLLFGVGLRLLELSGILALGTNVLAGLGIPRSAGRSLLSGALELTRGLTLLEPRPSSLPLCAALLGWGGVSVHCQTLSLLHAAGLESRPYLAGKLAQSILSGALAALALRLWPGVTEAARFATPLHRPAAVPAWELLLFSAALAGTMLLLSLLRRRK